MAKITSNELERYLADEHSSLILDDHWMVTLKNFADSNSFILPYVSSHEWSDITLYVAGKNDGPNSKSIESANNVLANLEQHLAQIGKRFRPEENAWAFTAIYAPYQYVDLCYLEYWSEYGVDVHAAVKLTDCKFGPAGILNLDDTEQTNIACLPVLVHYALSELENIDNVERTVVQNITSLITESEIMGPEIFASLHELVKIHYHSMSDPNKLIGQFRAAAELLANAG